MINAVIELGERRVHEVMVPRIAMVGAAGDATLDEAIDTVIEEGHSRIPVYEDSIDKIVGILYAKDLLPYLKGTVERAPERCARSCGRRCFVPGIDDRRRPAPRVPAPQGPHRDRARRVRRHGRAS